MAAVVTLLAKMRGGPAIDYQVLFCPAVDASGDMPSYAKFADGYFLTRAGLASAWDQVRTRPRGPSPSNGIAAAGDGRPIGRVASRPRGHRRTGHCA